MAKRKRSLLRNTFKRYWVQRKYKDRLFCTIFKNKNDLLDLYNAVNDTSYTNPDELIITTLEDTIILSMKNDLSFIISSDMNVYEHQSTFNPNMPIRGVLYFARLYEAYIAQHNLDIYGSKLILLPTPRYVIFYNGDTDKPDRMTLRLSDAFQISDIDSNSSPALECTAIMLNINCGHNEKLLNKCKRLKDYSIFVEKVKEYIKSGSLPESAIDRAIEECIEEGVLVDILLNQRALAKSALLTKYNEKERRRLDRKEGFEDGKEHILSHIIKKKIQKNIPLDKIAVDLETDVEFIRPIYENIIKRASSKDE